MTKLFVIGAIIIGAALADVPADEVKALPGWSKPLPSKQYSGYLTPNGTVKHLHYWFVESEGDPKNDPVVLWLNGGPGCSSLDGYLYEMGPFHVNESDTTQLYYNPYTWVKKANMIFIEAPAGVGFSYSDDWKDYDTNDQKTANDNRLALQDFFSKYPEYSSNKFYITGESYAGVYVPTLAHSIVTAKKAGTCNINLIGIAVGNGCTGNDVGVCSGYGDSILIPYLHAHGLFSDTALADINKNCPSLAPDAKRSDACNKAVETASDEVGHVSIYDIYGPCDSSPQGKFRRNSNMAAEQSAEATLRAPAEGRLLKSMLHNQLGGPDACIDSFAGGAWINRDVTRTALHLHMPPAKSGNWSTCGNNITYTRSTSNEPRDIYPDLVGTIQVLIYNGDADACVPYTDNEEWTSSFAKDNNIAVSKPWHAWNTGDDQVAGYATKYEKDFCFVTIKAAGHMVPQIKPKQAFSMFEKFLAGNSF